MVRPDKALRERERERERLYRGRERIYWERFSIIDLGVFVLRVTDLGVFVLRVSQGRRDPGIRSLG